MDPEIRTVSNFGQASICMVVQISQLPRAILAVETYEGVKARYRS
ncbi:hypothetical protein PIIN_10885 [Serendipita indica DSM 11827]|uniref:Uncharacterized protein n=1 Tax=Serendipita indica (strain DSM 11827) TaxID=1109443 RepID=G4U007_SERID|nr:hypothetical protein PIIN_10885 [Serendipita indica DSM 11827]